VRGRKDCCFFRNLKRVQEWQNRPEYVSFFFAAVASVKTANFNIPKIDRSKTGKRSARGRKKEKGSEKERGSEIKNEKGTGIEDCTTALIQA